MLKSDWSLGRYVNCENVTVRDSRVGTVGATALEIGSETAGNFTNILFENIVVTSAGDAGIGIVNMDGGTVRGEIRRGGRTRVILHRGLHAVCNGVLAPSGCSIKYSQREWVRKNDSTALT